PGDGGAHYDIVKDIYVTAALLETAGEVLHCFKGLISISSRILQFLHTAENLKNELRHSYTSRGRHESVAEHIWRVVLMAIVLRPQLPANLKWERLLEMLVIHDLAEAMNGDIPIFHSKHAVKKVAERKAMHVLRDMLPSGTGALIYELWEEFESQVTPEAQIANALDKLEAQVQHNEADLTTWL